MTVVPNLMPNLNEQFTALLDTAEARWNAVLRRDARLDGLLYYGVASTRIYCRPVCRARRPKIENVAFFRTCDEAEKAGYRPCKLCRPLRAARPFAEGSLSVRPVAVLFVDIREYSRMAAGLRPDEVFALLDAFHARMRAIVEANNGVIHKHLGDGFMAIFGALESTPNDARRGIECAFAMVNAIADWNEERRSVGAAPITIGVGLHYGMAAFGPAGGDQTIVGDTVNVASRLERLTRRLGADIALSDETLRATSAREDELKDELIGTRLHPVGVVRLSGCGPRQVWIAPLPRCSPGKTDAVPGRALPINSPGPPG